MTRYDHPMPVTLCPEIFLADPVCILLGMSTNSPAPQGLPYLMIDFAEDVLGDDVPMIVRSPVNDRIEPADQLVLAQRFVALHDFPELVQERVYVFLRRLDQKLTSSYLLIFIPKIETVIDMRDPCLFSRKRQAALREEFFDKRTVDGHEITHAVDCHLTTSPLAYAKSTRGTYTTRDAPKHFPERPSVVEPDGISGVQLHNYIEWF